MIWPSPVQPWTSHHMCRQPSQHCQKPLAGVVRDACRSNSNWWNASLGYKGALSNLDQGQHRLSSSQILSCVRANMSAGQTTWKLSPELPGLYESVQHSTDALQTYMHFALSQLQKWTCPLHSARLVQTTRCRLTPAILQGSSCLPCSTAGAGRAACN